MVTKRFEYWNRKLHYYLGLYFLFFLWLFSLTGLMLNHQQWFTDLYERTETRYDAVVELPEADTDLARARDVMRQLNLRGEIDWPATHPVGHLDFNVSRPNGAAQVRVDINARRAYVREFTNSHLHAFQIFHTFSGARYTQPASQRDWVLTNVWAFAMDALASGLVVIVLGSYYMWWRLKTQHVLGFMVLAAGFMSASIFVTGVL